MNFVYFSIICTWERELSSIHIVILIDYCYESIICSKYHITMQANTEHFIHFLESFCSIFVYIISNKNFTRLTHLCPPLLSTFAVRETYVSRHNGGTSGALLKPLRDDSALRALSTLRGLRGAPAVPPLCRETQSLGQQMLNATVGINGLNELLGL